MHLMILLREYWRAKRRASWDRASIEGYQRKRIAMMRALAVAHSPFYRDLYAGRENAPFEELPIVSKCDMMAHFSTFNTRGIDKETAFALALQAEEKRSFQASIGDVAIGLSSGTSGNRGMFLVSPQEQAGWCGSILGKALPRPLWCHQRIGLFLRSHHQLYETVRSSRLGFRYFDLQMPVEALIRQLLQFRPTTLVAPPSMLRLLCERQEVVEWIQNEPPDKILSCAEVLDPLDRDHLQRVFQQPIHEVYQATEGFLGTTCAYGTLHLNEDLLYIEREIVDAHSGRFVPILTDLHRMTQPILRYRLDDILVPKSSPCQCGSSHLALECVEGRSDDLLWLYNMEGKLIPLFPDFVRRVMISVSESCTAYQIVQDDPMRWTMSIEPQEKALQEAIQRSLLRYLAQQGFQAPQIIWVSFPDREPCQKLRRIRNLWKRPLPPSCGGQSDEALPRSCGGQPDEALPRAPLGSCAPQAPANGGPPRDRDRGGM